MNGVVRNPLPLGMGRFRYQLLMRRFKMTTFIIKTDNGMTIVVSATSFSEAEKRAIETGFRVVSIKAML